MKKILLLILLSISAQLFAQNKEWVDMNPPLSYGTSTVREVFSIGNDIYALTGIASVSQALPVKIEKWNASTNTWTVHVNDFELAVPFDKIEIKVEENKAYIATINHTTTFFYTFDGSTTMNTLFSWYGGGDVLFTSWDISVATNKIAVLAYGNGLGLEYLDLGSGSQMVYTPVTTTVSDTASLYINDNTDKAYVVEKVGSNMFAHSYDFVSQTVSQVYPAPFNISNSLTNTTASSNNNQFYLAPSQQEFPYLVYEEAAAGANAGIYAVLLDGLATSTEAVKITNDPVFNSFSLRSSNTEMSVVTGVNNAGSEFVNIFNFDYASGDVSTEGTINLPNDGTSRVRKTIGAISMGNQFLSLASDSEIAFKFLNTIPVRTSFYAGTPCVNNGDDIIDSIYVTDAEGANITMTYTGSSDASIINTANNQPVFTLNNAPVYYYLELNGGPFQTAGSCYVYYSLTDGLSTVNDSIAITVNANPTLTWSVPSYEFCNTDAVYDLHTDVSLTGGVFTNSLETPMTNIIDPATIGYNSIIYKYTDANGCVAQQSKNITINNTAVFNFNMDTSAFCSNVNDVPLAILGNDVSSAGGTLTYKTLPANLTIGNTINPATFASSSVEGTSTTSTGCVSKDTVYIKINQLPTINYTQDNYSVCQGQTLDLNTYVNQTGASFYLGTSSTSLPGDSYDTGMPGTNVYIRAEYNDPNGCGVAKDTAFFNTVPTTSSTTDITACASYTWTDGMTYTASGTYTQTLVNSNGCDSIASLNLTINQATNSTTTEVACNTYNWTDGMTYTTSGTYTQTLVNSNGCDSIATLNLTINQATNSTTTEVACASYTWTDGMTYTTSGTYTQTLVNANGCDSIATLNLTINQATNSTTTEVACNTYTWTDGMTYTTSGTYTQTLVNAVGCDSIATLNLTINQTTSSTTTEVACASYTWTDGMTYTTSGTYTQTLVNATGCDSIATLNLTINQTTNSTTTEVACNTYTWTDGMTYTTSGTYTQTLVNAVGCDSVATLNLTINQATNSTTTEVACATYTWTDGMTYTTSGTYTQTLTNAVGCDSIATLNLTINQTTNSTTTEVACNTYTWTDGMTYTTSGTYTQTLVNAVGCDSIATLNLTINQATSSTTTEVACVSYIWTDGMTYTTSGTYTQTLTNAVGCDSIATLELTINQPSAYTDLITACDTYTWIDGNTYTASNNTATHTITNAVGCDSVITLDLTINASPMVNFTQSTYEFCSNGGQVDINTMVDVPGGEFSFNGIPVQTNNGWLDIVGLSAGTLDYNFIDVTTGCSATATSSFNVINPATITLTITDAACGNPSGEIEANITGANGNYFTYWSNGESQVNQIQNLAPGAYYVNVEDDQGCIATALGNVASTEFDLTSSITNPTCAGDNDGAIDITLTGITAGYSVLWSTGASQEDVTGLSAGTHQVVITLDNGCSVTEDFVLLDPLPINMTPNITEANCGSTDGTVFFTLENAVGTIQYLWDNGSTQQSLLNIAGGNYELTVTDANGCTATQAVSLLNQNTAELTAAVTPTDCGSDNGAIDLFIPEIEGTNVQAILWSNTDVTEDLTALPAGAYGVQVTYDNGCNTYGNWQVSTKAPLQNDICLVTVDSLTTTNLVVWEKVQNATDGIDFYNIYRETSTAGEFLKIHEVEVEDESIFNDVVASPTTRSWRYKISAVNNCGVEGPLSSWHKTIHTVFSESPVQGEFNVSWDDYEGLTYSTVNLYRFTTNDGWELIGDNLPASQYQFTDAPTFTDQLDYMVEIMVDEICSSSEGKAQDFNSTRSNKTKGIFNPGEGTGDPNNGLEEFINDNFTVSVYPNPTAGLLNISAEFNNGNDFLKIRITDVLGKVKLNSALENGTSEIRLDHLQAGTYFITITDEEQREIFRVVKQ